MKEKNKRRIKSNFEILLSVVSIGFVIAISASVDWARISLEFNYFYIFLSIFFCLMGFVFQGLSWRYVLLAFNVNVTNKMAISSIARTIFSKYVPGKIWMMLGRANYISVRLDLPVKFIAKVSVCGQVFSILFSLILLSIFSFNLNMMQFESVSLKAMALVVSSVLLVCAWLYGSPERFLSLTSLKIAAYFCAMWLSWGAGFSVLCFGTPVSLPIQIDALTFVFIAASVVGIIAFIFPGGLGIREGGIVALLTLWDVTLEDAVTLAILARVWFLAAETIFFICFSVKKL